MKRILLILLLCSTYALSFGQTKPNTFVEETSPTNANFEVYSQKNDLSRRASLNNLKTFFDQYIYTKTDSICISRQAGDTCVYFVPTDIDSIGMSNDTIILYGGGDEIADLPVSRLEAVIEIGSGNITNGDIATVDIADGAINSAKIADGSIVSGDILDATIATADLANLAVTLAKIAANAIDSTKVVDGGLSGADLADAAILTAKIANGQITEAKIADNAVALGKIQQINSQRLLGRYSSGIGDVEQISLGTGLAWSGTSIVATGSAFNAADSISITKIDNLVTVFLWQDGSKLDSASFVDQTGVDVLNDLDDVYITSPSQGDVLIYDTTDARWEKASGYLGYHTLGATFDGMVVRIRYMKPFNLGLLSSSDFSGTAATGYTFTVPDGVEIISLSIAGGASNLNGSGDFDFTIITNWDGTEVSELYTVPRLQSGFFVPDWDVYGITGYYNNASTGNVQYIMSNLGTLGGSGFILYWNF